MRPFLFFAALSAGIFLAGSQQACTSDTIAPPDLEVCDTLLVTYNVEMKTLIDTYCAYSGCHAAGSTDGDFSSYVEMLPFLEGGVVDMRVIEIGDMPPNNVSSNKKISEEERLFFQCWLENGFPEF